ncbi:hypothetical protein [Streptomyces sp. CT34]|uniref:hypothetical protein n=1 Tax=Streptomyces sp. CT34 TaxID=1553907 RepID=UPI001F515FA5|nr:hypothetical protein [Streptomyces sp. CT34]
MSSDRLMRIHGAEFQAMSERVLPVTELTSRLNALPFEDEASKAELFERILGKPLPTRVTICPPFSADHGLHLHLAERVFINQNCMFLDYAGIRLGERVMVGPKVTFIISGHPIDPRSGGTFRRPRPHASPGAGSAPCEDRQYERAVAGDHAERSTALATPASRDQHGLIGSGNAVTEHRCLLNGRRRPCRGGCGSASPDVA